MRASKSLIAVCLVATLGAGPVQTQEAHDSAQGFFDKLRSLEGRWQAESTKGWNEVVTFEVIARGSVVMEVTEFRESPESKMITMFYMDGDDLVVTHYCEARNQPRLVAEEIDLDAGRAVFAFVDGGNIPDRDRGHMDRAVYQIADADTFSSRWTWYQDGTERWLEDIRLTRIR